jgi:hypothetical protein
VRAGLCPLTATGGHEEYGKAALANEVGKVMLARPGQRNSALNAAAFSLGQLVEGGVLEEAVVVEALTRAAEAVELDASEIGPTIRSGVEAGKKQPRSAPDKKLHEGNAHAPARRCAAPEMPVPPAAPWPAAPAEEAYHGLAGDFVRLVGPQTESDEVALLAQFLVFFGNAAGRNGYRQVEAKRHHGNLFAVLVGRTSRGRKGTALSWIESVFRSADKGWADNNIQNGLSSGEGLINAVRDPVVNGKGEKTDAGVEDKRLLVIEEEFSSVLRQAGRDGNILSSVLRQAWDGGRLRNLTKHSPLRATGAHISIVGHVTRDELLRCVSQVDQANGFINRFLWLAVRRPRLLPEGGEGVDLKPLAERLPTALGRTSKAAMLKPSDAYRRLWRQEYPRLTAERPGAFGLATARAEAQVLRLAAVYALTDNVVVTDNLHGDGWTLRRLSRVRMRAGSPNSSRGPTWTAQPPASALSSHDDLAAGVSITIPSHSPASKAFWLRLRKSSSLRACG